MKSKKQAVDFSRDTTRIILDSISDGVFTIDDNWKITSFNRAAEKITGVSAEEAIDRHCWDVFRSNMCEKKCALKRTMEEKKSFISTSAYIINADQKRIPIFASTSLLIDKNGEVLGGVEVFRDLSLEEALRKEITSGFQMGDMVSRNDAMKRVFRIMPKISKSDATVLIEGETGTGKELTARALHNMSARKDNPFIAINCGALPDTLLESELFGHKAGAFTGAVKDKPGHFAMAKGGTIFLDEIGDTSPAFQVRLLRVLQEHEFTPLGGVKKEETDIRIIASTNKDLDEMVENGEFRQDLYYRINVVNIKLPPLRERLEDIPLLVDRFITKMNRVKGAAIKEIHKEALSTLMTHTYPGNIRELENVIEHAFVLCTESTIQLHHLPAYVTAPAGRNTHAGDAAKKNSDPVKKAEIQVILEALKRNSYNRKKAAADLGIHKSTLYRKMHRLNISPPQKQQERD